MPTRTIVLTAAIAACVSSALTLAVALLVVAPMILGVTDRLVTGDRRGSTS